MNGKTNILILYREVEAASLKLLFHHMYSSVQKNMTIIYWGEGDFLATVRPNNTPCASWYRIVSCRSWWLILFSQSRLDFAFFTRSCTIQLSRNLSTWFLFLEFLEFTINMVFDINLISKYHVSFYVSIQWNTNTFFLFYLKTYF